MLNRTPLSISLTVASFPNCFTTNQGSQWARKSEPPWQGKSFLGDKLHPLQLADQLVKTGWPNRKTPLIKLYISSLFFRCCCCFFRGDKGKNFKWITLESSSSHHIFCLILILLLLQWRHSQLQCGRHFHCLLGRIHDQHFITAVRPEM